MDSLTQTQENVLYSLSVYRYLTAEQMVRIGVTKDKRHLYSVLTNLLSVGQKDKPERRPKEIGELDFGIRVGQGRLPRLYYLTKKGAELLSLARSDLQSIKEVKRPTKFNNDYFHRVYTVDCHIALRAFAEAEGHEVRYFKSYFDFTEKSQVWPHPKTRIAMRTGFVDPDGLTVLDCSDGVERLFAIEMANGMNTKKVERQILRYCEAIADEDVWQACDVADDTDVRVLFIFEHQRGRELVQERLKNDRLVQTWRKHFYFRDLLDVKENSFVENWQSLEIKSAGANLFKLRDNEGVRE